MNNIKDYNKKVADKWNDAATKLNAKLFMSLIVTEQGEISAFWDNAMGNKEMIRYLKQITKLLEDNVEKNYGGN